MRAVILSLCVLVAPLEAQRPEPPTLPPEALAALIRAVIPREAPARHEGVASAICVALAPSAPPLNDFSRWPAPDPDSLSDLPPLAHAALVTGDSSTNSWTRTALHPRSACIRDTLPPDDGSLGVLRLRVRATGELAAVAWLRDVVATSDSTGSALVGWWVPGHGIEGRCDVLRRGDRWVRRQCKQLWHAQG